MQSKTTRTIGRYNPFLDAVRRHPRWTIKQVELHGIGEVFDVRVGVILVDIRHGRPQAWAHAIAHLDLGHTAERHGGSFTEGAGTTG